MKLYSVDIIPSFTKPMRSCKGNIQYDYMSLIICLILDVIPTQLRSYVSSLHSELTKVIV